MCCFAALGATRPMTTVFMKSATDSSQKCYRNRPSDSLGRWAALLAGKTRGGRNELLERTADLERESGKPAFATRYARFMELAANHIEVLAPFMPALAQMLIGIKIS